MTDSGLYVVGMSLPKPTRIKIGALGRIEFSDGLYLYIGSAKKGLSKRVARHKRRSANKKMRWHIDYLRRHCRFEFAKTFPGMSDECELARSIAKDANATIAYPRFGASDCRCPSHLYLAGEAFTLR